MTNNNTKGLYNNLDDLFDLDELMKRAIKYLIQGFFVAVAAFVIPDIKRALQFKEVATISLVAAATFAILDTYIPSIGSAARGGAGFGIGANLVGFPGGL